jgi:hypothetical protein
MPKPVCVKCQRFFRMTRSGKTVLEQMPANGSAPPGASCPEAWRPYKLWKADLWTCPSCGFELASGFGARAFHERHKEGFAADLEKARPSMITVNDC